MVTKDKISIVLRSIISFGLLIALIWIMRNDIGDIWDVLKNSNKLFFLIAISLSIPLTILLSYRLKLLMLGQKISLPMTDFIYLTFIGFFFNNFLPTAIGGDIVKAYYASKKTNNKAASYAAVVADRLVGFLAVLSVAIIGIVFIGKDIGNNKIIWAVAMMLILLIILILFVLNEKKAEQLMSLFAKNTLLEKVREKILKLFSAINFYKHSKTILIKAYLLGVFMQSCTVVSIYFFILCIGGNIHLLKLFLVIPLVWAISMLPSLNGLGVREGAFVYFLKGDIGPEKAFAISLLWLGVIILYGLIGGVMHLFHPVKTKF